jgi:hypothetical protein
MLTGVKGCSQQIGEDQERKKPKKQDSKEHERNSTQNRRSVRHSDRARDQRDDKQDDREFQHSNSPDARIALGDVRRLAITRHRPFSGTLDNESRGLIVGSLEDLSYLAWSPNWLS